MTKNIDKYLILLLVLFFFTGCTPEHVQEDLSVKKQEKNEQELEDLRAHFIDVGQADATFVEYVEGNEEYRILIDTGDWNVTNVVDYLKAQEVTEIDLVVATHPHADHIGQLADVIEEFEVLEVWMSGDLAETQVFERALDAIAANDIDYHEPRSGERYEMGTVSIEVIHPTEVTGNLNNGSISIRLEYGDVSFLFTGDAEISAEEEMIAREHELASTILSVPHHGSDTSSSIAFLEAVVPEIAVYSAGKDNSYGHPHEEVLTNLEASGAIIYGTDRDGTVLVETDGVNYEVLTKTEQTITPDAKPNDERASEEIMPDRCIDINSAYASELEEIIEIGPERALELMELRPFVSIDDLKKLTGIGEARIGKIKEQGLACIGG
ncbi:MBL fold metallo-hydrolase [Shouchella patagoniensis]|uniref:MBL fold metallo-hydrolase n=1 Tax=Shouchella patagoniensis TaxID=228576 RepID=UPI000994BA3C|nr:MBL fold metallo-hydrolase [Shouchella patagoniensis]